MEPFPGLSDPHATGPLANLIRALTKLEPEVTMPKKDV